MCVLHVLILGGTFSGKSTFQAQESINLSVNLHVLLQMNDDYFQGYTFLNANQML